MNIKDKIKNFPESPGIYIMKSSSNEIIYVGKAKSLKNRVSSYFLKSNLDLKTNNLVKEISDIDFIITESEYEALILECNFIKNYKPYFNIQLKDSKNYSYIEITDDQFPSIQRVRKITNTKSQYFGPYTSSLSVKRIMKLLSKIFKIRICKLIFNNKNQKRSCLLKYINQCLSPCTGDVDSDTYSEAVKNVILFLRGEHKALYKKLNETMLLYAEKENFEYASILRDQISCIDEIIQKQRVIYSKPYKQDIFAMYNKDNYTCIEVMKIREGKILYEDSFFIESIIEEKPLLILSAFLSQYFLNINKDMPSNEIILSENIKTEENNIIHLLKDKYKLKKIKFTYPELGEKREVLNLCRENAKKHYELKYLLNVIKLDEKSQAALNELKSILSLNSLPERIEGYDISNISGINSVGSMVTFLNSKPLKEYYRRFKIKYTQGPNDVGMIKEVLKRRFTNKEDKFKIYPDLLLIDGGLPQLNAAKEVLNELKINIPIISLAKREELVYTEKDNLPIKLDQYSEALKLLQNIRNEAHRFAKAYFTKLHRKEVFS